MKYSVVKLSCLQGIWSVEMDGIVCFAGDERTAILTAATFSAVNTAAIETSSPLSSGDVIPKSSFETPRKWTKSAIQDP